MSSSTLSSNSNNMLPFLSNTFYELYCFGSKQGFYIGISVLEQRDELKYSL